MLKVYNYMSTGVLLTGIIALLTFKMSVVTSADGSIVALTEIGNAIYLSGLKWIIMLAPLGIVFYMSFGINKMSSSKAQTVFWIFAGLMGLSLSSILLVYTGLSVTRVFFITSATFGAMSIYGYTTKRPYKIWILFNDGFNWDYNCIFSKYFFKIIYDVLCYINLRGTNICRTYSL